MSITPETSELFIREHQPVKLGRLTTWLCMDDRFAPGQGLYRQTGGGAFGAAQDAAITLEVQRFHSFVAQGKSIHMLASLATKILAPKGVNLWMHEGCAAYGAGKVIAETVFNRPDEVLSRAQQMRPDLEIDEDRFAAVAAGFERLVAAGSYADIEISDKHLLQGTENDGIALPPVPRVPLVAASHTANTVIVTNRQGVAWDAEAAWNAGTPSYFVSGGDMHELYTGLSPALSLNPDIFDTVSTIRHAATNFHLPAPGTADGTPDIHFLAA